MKSEIGNRKSEIAGWRWLRLGVTLAAIAGVAALYVPRHGEQFGRILHVGAPALAAMLLLTLASGCVNSLVNWSAANCLGARLSLVEAGMVFWATAFANFLPMRAGLVLQGVYLKRSHGLSYARFASLAIAAHVIFFLVIGVLGVVLSLPSALAGECGAIVPAGFAAVVVLGLLVFALPTGGRPASAKCGVGNAESGSRSALRTPHSAFARLRAAASGVGEGWHMLRTAPGVLAVVAVASAGSILLAAARLVVAYRALGYSTPWSAVLLVSMASGLVELLSIVPGGLGLREAATGGMGTAFGNAFSTGVVAGTLERAASMAVIFVLGALSLHFLVARAGRSGGQPPGVASGGSSG